MNGLKRLDADKNKRVDRYEMKTYTDKNFQQLCIKTARMNREPWFRNLTPKKLDESPDFFQFLDVNANGYLSMLEVQTEIKVGHLKTYEENRGHFGAWCVVSSPLILSLDLRNDKTVDSVWDIIANREAIAVL